MRQAKTNEGSDTNQAEEHQLPQPNCPIKTEDVFSFLLGVQIHIYIIHVESYHTCIFTCLLLGICEDYHLIASHSMSYDIHRAIRLLKLLFQAVFISVCHVFVSFINTVQ